MRKLRSIFFVLGLMGIHPSLPMADEIDPEEVRRLAEETVALRQQAQALQKDYAQKKHRLLEEEESLKKRIVVLEHYTAKTQRYLDSQRAKVEELERQLVEVDRFQKELDPLLDHFHEKLTSLVNSDLPFLKEERQARLLSIKNELDDYDTSAAEKTRRLLEALNIEVRFGSHTEATEVEAIFEGRRRRMHQLRVGRLGLFAMGPDGQQAYRFDSARDEYEAIHAFAHELEFAFAIAEKRRISELVEIPFGVLSPGAVDAN
jgi:hypothetical protein